MSRSQQGQVFQTAQDQNKTLNQNATQDFQKSEQGVTDYGNQLSKFAASNPYVQGGELQTAQGQQLADVSRGTADATKQAIEGAAVRTGSNMGGAVAGAEEVAQDNQRTLAGQVAKANEDRIAGEAGYNQTALGGYQTKEQMQDQLAQQQQQGAEGTLNTSEEAAKQPSFMDMLGQGMITAGQTFASAYCPAEGSMFLMADGTRKPAEALRVGDRLEGIDGHAQTIQRIVTAVVPVMAFSGTYRYKGRASRSHALALPYGGFTSVAEAAGKLVRADCGAVEILDVWDDGTGRVFNVVTDGSHTYCADGFWALGMSEAELDAAAEAEQQLVGEVC